MIASDQLIFQRRSLKLHKLVHFNRENCKFDRRHFSRWHSNNFFAFSSFFEKTLQHTCILHFEIIETMQENEAASF